MEEEVDAAVFLCGGELLVMIYAVHEVEGERGEVKGKRGLAHLSSQSHTSRNQSSGLAIPSSHHTELAGGDELAEVLNLFLNGRVLGIGVLVGIG